MEKRSSDQFPELLEPVLMRLDNDEHIHIDKNEFKIGRAKDNDEIILDVTISRRHCIFRCNGDDEWVIKDLSSSATFVNNVPLVPGAMKKISPGDIIQFSHNETFKYLFTYQKREPRAKKPRIDEKILDTVIIKQKTFAESQECQKKELKNKLQIKQKEQDELKRQLVDLLSQNTVIKDDKDELLKQISQLEGKIQAGNGQEEQLQRMYSELLERLENERLQFEARINEEKQKWQEALDMSKLEKDMLEARMKEQMEKWREEQQIEWRNMMENKVKEERNIQFQLMNEKTMLEEKLKETEKALKEQEAKTETAQMMNGIEQLNTIEIESATTENCIVLEFLDVDQSADLHILDTIDLTRINEDIDVKDNNVIAKVSGIMDEQLTCSICSELFVSATTLNCTHSFCFHCISIWKKKRRECPICRKPITAMNKSLVLDNFIESMIDNLPTDLKARRTEILQERAVMEKKRY